MELCAQRGIPLLFLQNIMVRAIACAGWLPTRSACSSAGEDAELGRECFIANTVGFVTQSCHLNARCALKVKPEYVSITHAWARSCGVQGFMVGRKYEAGGIAKDGAKMVMAVANAQARPGPPPLRERLPGAGSLCAGLLV